MQDDAFTPKIRTAALVSRPIIHKQDNVFDAFVDEFKRLLRWYGLQTKCCTKAQAKLLIDCCLRDDTAC
jgi:hypothetical protein